MDELEVCRLSAEALEKKLMNGSAQIWNPLTTTEQRWECVEWLLKQYKITLWDNFGALYGNDLSFDIECPVSEFPARAIAELQRRKSGK